jgi:protoheme IX farnesyltransferase
MFVTKVHILAFIIAYLIATIAFDSVGNAGYFYLFSIIAFGADWLWRGIQGFKLETDMQNVDGKNAGGKGTVDTRWARKTFLFSLIVLVSFCVTISLAPLVP